VEIVSPQLESSSVHTCDIIIAAALVLDSLSDSMQVRASVNACPYINEDDMQVRLHEE
jgi:hypothetical protein